MSPGLTAADFEPVIGLEVHCQLRTASKAFCGCSTRFGDPPNTNTCVTCLGFPGALPVFNERALDLALKLALAVGARVAGRSVFARKNYFYPDLPKGYQISQYEAPLAEGGSVEIEVAGSPPRAIRLTRIHLEEDAGKSLHEASPTTTFVDFNRSGVPLVEVVSEPEFRSSAEAHAYLSTLRQLVRHLGVSDGNMEQGSLRCDCNVSLRPRGATEFGTRVELKNLNSFRSVVRALEHEFDRQAALLRRGEAVEHGTRLFDEAAGVTRPLRRKELARDYRYFPDPDLPPLIVAPERLKALRHDLPELPAARHHRFVAELGLPEYDARVLTQSRAVADYFEAATTASGDAKATSNWVLGEVLRDLRDRNVDLEADAPGFPVTPDQLAGLVAIVRDGLVSLSAAKKVFEAMAGTDRAAVEVVAELGLAQVSDAGALRETVRRVMAEQAGAVADYRGGNERTFGFLVGQVMRHSGGKANPQVVRELLRAELDGPPEPPEPPGAPDQPDPT